MSPQELQNQIDVLTKQIKELERISIKLDMDVTSILYLQPAVQQAVAAVLLTYPTQTYSTVTPTGTAPTGSIWMQNTGVLATNTIWMYSGSGWTQIK